LSTNCDTEDSGTGPWTSTWGRVVGGPKELGTSRLDDFRLAYLDVNVVDAVIQQKLFALKSCIDGNFVEEGIRIGSNSENDIPGGLIDVADTDDISTGPARILSVSTTTAHPLLIQDGGYLLR
jgi:hypothetical protein